MCKSLFCSAIIGTAILSFAPGALAAPPQCGDNKCNGGEFCDGTDFCKSTSCPEGTVPVCDETCGGFSCVDDGSGGGGGNAEGTIELLFTDRSDNVEESNITPEEQRLLDLIDSETVAIQASIDGLSRSNVVDRLIAAHQDGVTVQVVADCQIVIADANPQYQLLIDAGIPVVDDNNTFDGPSVDPGCTSNQTSGFVHNKFLIFEGQQTVWTGSTNLTDFGFNSSQNSIVILSGNSEIVDFYTAEFNEMFGDGVSLRDGGTGQFGRQKDLDPGIGSFTLADGTNVEIAFSPYNHNTTSDTEQLIQKAIDSADTELLWGTFFLTYDPVRDRIAANSATAKRGAVDPRTTDDFDDTAILINGGEDVLVTNFLGSHHWKFICSDADASDGKALLASHNFSSSSFNFNNENSILVHSADAAQSLRSEFDVVWDDPQNVGLVSCIHPGESYNENSKTLHRCNDDFDNDFDGLTDLEDDDCAAFFECGTSSCKASGESCSDGAECCSGTCLHGRTRTCS